MFLATVTALVIYTGGVTVSQVGPHLHNIEECGTMMAFTQTWPSSTMSKDLQDSLKGKTPQFFGCYTDDLKDVIPVFSKEVHKYEKTFANPPSNQWWLKVIYAGGTVTSKGPYQSAADCAKDLVVREAWDNYTKSWIYKPQLLGCIERSVSKHTHSVFVPYLIEQGKQAHGN